MEPDEIAGHLSDIDRLSHVEDENLAAFAHDTGLQDQLRRLGDRHEITGDLGMGYREGPPSGDLLLEQGDHRPGAADHVAEPDSHKARPMRSMDTLDKYFGYAFCCAHHIGRADSLVRGHEDESLDLVVQRRIGYVPRAQDICEEGFTRVELLHRYVLVGRGVEDDVGLEARENPFHQFPIPDICEKRLDGRLNPPPMASHLDLKEVELAEIQQTDGLGTETG